MVPFCIAALVHTSYTDKPLFSRSCPFAFTFAAPSVRPTTQIMTAASAAAAAAQSIRRRFERGGGEGWGYPVLATKAVVNISRRKTKREWGVLLLLAFATTASALSSSIHHVFAPLLPLPPNPCPAIKDRVLKMQKNRAALSIPNARKFKLFSNVHRKMRVAGARDSFFFGKWRERERERFTAMGSVAY